MTTVRVWAPRAREVELICGGVASPLRSAAGGWWELDAPGLVHGADYGFRLDGEGPFPDPRSPWQPHGVHGPSRFVDHGRFAWTDAGWRAPPLSAAVILEVHVGTFTPAGTFDGTIERLDHVADLGVTHLQLMPVNAFPGERGWGYDGVALFAPHQPYGGPDGLKRLVDACHGHGIAVLLDVVYNHLGPDGNHLGRYGPYFTDAHRTPWGDAVNFDRAGSDEVRRFVLDNAVMWLRDYHLDGLRIDAIHAMVDASATHVLEELGAEVRRLEGLLGRPLVTIAESDLNDPRVVRPVEAGGLGLDAQWSDDFHHALHGVLTGERGGYYADFGGLHHVARALERGFVYDGAFSPHRQRRHGRPATGLGGRRLLGFLQNHDQIGNRAMGERSSHLMSTGLLKVGAALVLTAPFVPLLFQGEAWGATSPFLYFTDHQDPDLAAAVREGRRREFAAFGWDPEAVPDPQDLATFQRSRLAWGERERAPHDELLAWHRDLIALRRVHPALADDRLEAVEVRFDEDERWLVVLRPGLVVACNLGREERRVACAEAAGGRVLLASDPQSRIDGGGFVLEGESVVVVRPVSGSADR
jgi:maltooligosyltrehalose trehalohydrolase